MSDPDQLLYVGLGNPGKEYEMTRHNIGQMVLARLVQDLGLTFKHDSYFEADIAKGIVDGVKAHFLFPKTYMNESGRAVRRYIDFYKLLPEQVCLVCDDIDLPYGDKRLKETGGPGSHNGLKSIEKHLSTKSYIRLRMGIGGKKGQQDLADHVLSRFNASEVVTLDLFVKEGALILRKLASEDIKSLMNTINKKVKKTKKIDLLQTEGQEKKND